MSNARGVFDVPIAEWNITMMVQLLRDGLGMYRNQEEAKWDRSPRFQSELRGSTLGSWGYGGIGRETARQLAINNGTEKIILAGRNRAKLESAQNELIELTGRNIFEVLIIDVANMESVREAIDNLSEPFDALIMNAGGTGGKTPGALTQEGVTHLFAVNVLGHALFLQEILKRNLLSNVAVFAGSEAIVGVPFMGMKRPKLTSALPNRRMP